MKAANFLNLLLATAVVLLCAKLHLVAPATAESATSVMAPPPPPAAMATEKDNAARGTDRLVIDSTGLAPHARGFGGHVPVEVEITNGAVARVSPKMPNGESPMFFEMLEEAGLWNAWNGLPVSVAATARVDAVTSATYSSKAAIENVRAALASVPGARAGGSTAPSGAPSAQKSTGWKRTPPTPASTNDRAMETTRAARPSPDSASMSAKSSGRLERWQTADTDRHSAGKKSLPDQPGTTSPTERSTARAT